MANSNHPISKPVHVCSQARDAPQSRQNHHLPPPHGPEAERSARLHCWTRKEPSAKDGVTKSPKPYEPPLELLLRIPNNSSLPSSRDGVALGTIFLSRSTPEPKSVRAGKSVSGGGAYGGRRE